MNSIDKLNSIYKEYPVLRSRSQEQVSELLIALALGGHVEDASYASACAEILKHKPEDIQKARGMIWEN
jgi:hypothetical protein